MEARCSAVLLARQRACDPPVPTPAALLAAPFPSIVRGWFLLEQHMRSLFGRETTCDIAHCCVHSWDRACRALCAALPRLHSVCLASGPLCGTSSGTCSCEALATRLVYLPTRCTTAHCTMLAASSAYSSHARPSPSHDWQSPLGVIQPHHEAPGKREAASSLFGCVADPCAPGYLPGLPSLPTLLSPPATPDFLFPLFPHAHLRVWQLVSCLGSQGLVSCPCKYARVSLPARVSLSPDLSPALIVVSLRFPQDFSGPLFHQVPGQVWQLVLQVGWQGSASRLLVRAHASSPARVHAAGHLF